MRPREVAREALRNLWAGVGHSLIWMGATALLLGGLVVFDARQLVQANLNIDRWRSSGASVMVAYAAGSIDGNACERLGRVPGITGAGAMRLVKDGPRLPALPLGSPTFAEATPGFVWLIAHGPGGSRAADAAPAASLAEGGLLLSEPLANTVGRGPGSTLATTDGPARVAGAFAAPRDGRQTPLEYAALAQVPAVGRFDYCWAEVWPPNPAVAALVRSVADPQQVKAELTVGQLNPTLGANLDALALYRDRITHGVAALAAFAGLILGLASIRTRRVELASALHAGVTPAAQRGQVLMEAAAWGGVGSMLAAVTGWIALEIGNPVRASYGAAAVASCVIAGFVGVAVGVLVGLAMTREKYLFRYFKNR